MELVLFFILALLAEVLGTIGGFGSSLFFVPLAGYFFDFQHVLGITALFHVFSNVSKIALFRKGFDKNAIIWMGIPSVVFVLLGAWLSKFVDPGILELTLGIVLIALSLLLMRDSFAIQPNRQNALIGGIASGFIAGIVGTGGAIRGITLAAFNLPKEIFIATSAIIDFAIDAGRAVVYAGNGYIQSGDFYLMPGLLGVGIIGTWLGKKALEHISESRFRAIVIFMVFLTGVLTIGKKLWSMYM